jgi:ketosteroid isomerase-like protein
MKSIPCLLLLLALAPGVRASDHQQLCAELTQTERDFCALAAKVGVSDAFLANMADDCFVPQRFSLSRAEFAAAVTAARARAGAAYKPGPNPDQQLVWTPLKVDVSSDGTLGYTWGRYDLTLRDKEGKRETTTGVYLTIWKRQANGSWKFVFDGGPELPADPAALGRFLARPDIPRPPGAVR